jgi:hypothetical protein
MPIVISGTTVTFNDSSSQTTNVPNETAALSAGAVGTYAMLSYPGNVTESREEGFTIAGSNLRYSNVSQYIGNTPGGSWRLMGSLAANVTPKSTSYARTSVWLRYA